MNTKDIDNLKENMIFVGTIYDSFEALEETLGKLKLEKPLFITHIAKMAFAEEVFKRAEDDNFEQNDCISNISFKKNYLNNDIIN